MKKIIKRFVAKLTIFLSSFYKGNEFGSIYYHDVVLGEGESFNKININRFREQMKYIIENEYETQVFADLDKQDKIIGKKVLITFDDGYVSNYDLVFPIMKEYNLKFNVFLEVSKIGYKDNYLNWDMIKVMNESGLVGFGAHTFNHVDSRYISERNYKEEIELVNMLIEKQIGLLVKDYCFPFGAYNDYIINYLSEKQVYKRLYTSDGSKNSNRNGTRVLGRVGIDNNDEIDIFIEKLQGKYNLYYKVIRTLKQLTKGANNEYHR